MRRREGGWADPYRIFEIRVGLRSVNLSTSQIVYQKDNFFQNEMGLNVTLIPCLENLSCRFEFGVAPKPIFEDPIYNTSCLSICSQQKTGKESCSYLAPS